MPPVQFPRRIFWCGRCGEKVADGNDLLLTGPEGAFVFRHAVNFRTGSPEECRFSTGGLILARFYCESCGENLGWKCLHAYEASQRYKEGCYVLDMSRIDCTVYFS